MTVGRRAAACGAALLLLVWALSGSSGKAAAGPAFPDVAGHWAQGYIATLAGRGILSGYPDGTFRPDGTITRLEFAAVLAKAKGLSSKAKTPYFSDVGEDSWGFPYVQALAEARVLHPEDYGGRLSPDSPITRVEIATMLVRAAGLEGEVGKEGVLTSFSDTVPAWARGYVAVALDHGLVTGYDDGTFGASRNATRAEAGLMVLRLLDPKVRPATWTETYAYKGNTLKVVRVNFNRDDIEIRPALAGSMKDTAYLADIANAQGAVAAVNGGYFSAYSNDKGDFGEAYNALEIDGTWVHFQYQGTALGITYDKRIIMDPVRMAITGSTNGQPGAWSAWSVNHTSPDIIGIFNKYRGATTQMADGITFTVRNGRIVSKGGPDVPIPEDGYVIFVSNSRVNRWTDVMFPVGASVEYQVQFNTGEAMADLGAYNAMQLDSGASSCLWYEGEYLTSPGRAINNALVVVSQAERK